MSFRRRRKVPGGGTAHKDCRITHEVTGEKQLRAHDRRVIGKEVRDVSKEGGKRDCTKIAV